jgi:hypothetical protein
LSFQLPEDGRPAAANGDEMDLALVDARQFRAVDHLAVEEEPTGVGTSDFVPEFHEPHEFAVRIGAGQIGVGVAQAAAVLFEREDGEHTRAGRAAEGQVMSIQRRGIAAERDRMEVA